MIEKPQSAIDAPTSREHGDVHAQPPIDLDLVIGEPGTVAGGIPAVMSSMKHALRAAGPLRAAHVFRNVNQRNGFDCPSCAWADPKRNARSSSSAKTGPKRSPTRRPPNAPGPNSSAATASRT